MDSHKSLNTIVIDLKQSKAVLQETEQVKDKSQQMNRLNLSSLPTGISTLILV